MNLDSKLLCREESRYVIKYLCFYLTTSISVKKVDFINPLTLLTSVRSRSRLKGTQNNNYPWSPEKKGLVARLCLTLCNPMDCRLPGSSPWHSPGKNTGVGCHFLLWGIFPTQGSNLGLLHCRRLLYHLSHQVGPKCQAEGGIQALTIEWCVLTNGKPVLDCHDTWVQVLAPPQTCKFHFSEPHFPLCKVGMKISAMEGVCETEMRQC